MDEKGKEFDEQKAPDFKIDPKHVQGFIKLFKNLPDDARCIRFFNRKEYYTVHGENATFIAKTYFRTMTALSQIGSSTDPLPSVSVSNRLFQTIIRDLLLERTDHVIEVYEGSGSSFQMTKSASPGRLSEFEEILFSNNDMQDIPVIASVQIISRENERFVGLAFIDSTRRRLGLTEFLDDDHFGNLETAILALGCRESLLPQDIGSAADNRRIEDVLERCSCLVTKRKKGEFRGQSVRQDVSRLLKDAELLPAELDMAASSGAMAALLSYTEILSDDSNFGKFILQPYSLSTHMKLDAAALRAMNVLESKSDGNKNFSLVGLMNRTCTAGMGKRLLTRWLKQPLVDANEINFRLDAVEAFVDDAELRQDIRQHLKRVPDVERIARKLERKKANLKDVVKLYQASVRLPLVRDCFARYEGKHDKFLAKRYNSALEEWTGEEHLGKYDGLVEAAIDLQKLEEGEYLISAGYDESLAQIKIERDNAERQIRAAHEAAASDLGLAVEKCLKLDKTPQYGYVFRVSKKEETAVRKKLSSSYISIETRKDGIKFTNSRLRKLSEQHTKLTEQYTSTQKELVAKVVDVASTFVEVFEGIANLLAELDVLLSFADLSVSAPTPYVRPGITPSSEGDIILEGSRHPCVEVQDDISFIPNDCRMVRGKSWFQIITGPNMGGKSTFIRQVGVNVLMAQVGCFVPCHRAQISVRDCIFARVGAGDCQLRGVSTFMAEMLETATILKSATDKSLIIIDELGRGTSTYDGFGLAWAICENLVDVVKAPALFATHFHELTSLASSPSAGIANLHVSAHIEQETQKLTMLYKVEEGPCDQSFGIHVAEFAHFPESVVAMARAKAAELEDFSPETAEEEIGQKRKRVIGPDDASRGAFKAQQFLREFAALPLDEMSREDAFAKVAELTSGLEEEAAGNPWLKELIQK